ncbi:MAG: PKD domain-containing protein, partial [Bacteroidetes bacterium]|nr:PKD domain-containing protein [Bacteroidota bacterium]
MKTSTSNSEKNFFSLLELSGVKKLAAAAVILLCGLNISYKTNAQCVAGFSYSADSSGSGTIYFFDTSSFSAPIVSWAWVFGDSTTSTLQNPGHIYALADTYWVCLTITISDSVGSTCNWCTSVIVIMGSCNNPPTADFTYTPSNLTVNFADASSPVLCITSWFWDFGDGNTDTIQNPSHTYTSAGTYNICLTAATIGGNNTICKNITVLGSGCIAGFSYSADSSGSGTIYFFDTSSFSAPIISWAWDFGDATTSTLQNPWHTYALADTYWVCLTITISDSIGSTCNWCTGVIAGIPCQRTISGQVSDNAGAIISGTVDLINYSPVPGQMTIAATTALDNTGYYTFTNVSQGQYLIRAEGDSALYPNTVLTYYDSTNHWQNATIVDASSVCDTTIIANIKLVEFPNNNGPGNIS